MNEENQKPHCNKLPSDPEELGKFIDSGFEGEAREVDLKKRFYEIVDELVKDGIEYRKRA